MAIAINDGDIIRMTLFSTLFDVQQVNVFHAVIEDVGAELVTLGELAVSFKMLVLESVIAPVLLADVNFTECKYEVISRDPIPYFVDSLDVNGSIVATGLPSPNAYGFKQGVETGLTRPGGKRFSGIPESYQTGNDLTAGALTALIPVRNMLSYGFNIENSGFLFIGTARWIIYGDIIPITRPTPVWQKVTSCTINPKVTSQVSRKK